MWGKLNGVRIAQSKTQSHLHGNTRKMSEIIIPEKRTKMACNGVGDTQAYAQGNEKRLKRVAAR